MPLHAAHPSQPLPARVRFRHPWPLLWLLLYWLASTAWAQDAVDIAKRLHAQNPALYDRFGKLAGWAVLLSCFISATNAVVRYGFDYSSNAFLEIQWYLFAGCVMPMPVKRGPSTPLSTSLVSKPSTAAFTPRPRPGGYDALHRQEQQFD